MVPMDIDGYPCISMHIRFPLTSMEFHGILRKSISRWDLLRTLNLPKSEKSFQLVHARAWQSIIGYPVWAHAPAHRAGYLV